MNAGSAGVRRWTERFVLTSAAFFVAYLISIVVPTDPHVPALLALFGFVCPMIFGMGYLLLPAYVGRTLVDHRRPGVHFVFAYLGVGALVVGRAFAVDAVFASGAVFWSLGVAVFLGSLLFTVGPVLAAERLDVVRRGDGPQRSTKLATLAIPISLSYLVVGTVALLGTAGIHGYGARTLPAVVHYHAIGFGALLIFALSARLLIGFFHVTPPRYLVWLTLVTGAVAPLLLGTYLWIDPWFTVGAGFALVAMVGYLLLVSVVVARAERRRPGLVGVFLGAISGTIAVTVSAAVAFEAGSANAISIHGAFILGGFFPLTIVGYAVLFFPVTSGPYVGASRRGVLAIIGLLAVGVLSNGVGIAIGSTAAQLVGVTVSILGAVGYVYLVAYRFLGG